MSAGSIATIFGFSMAALALSACRGAGTTAVDEPPKTVVVEQSPPGAPTAPVPGGELGLNLGDNEAEKSADAGPRRGPRPQPELENVTLPALGAPCSPAAPSAAPPTRRTALDPCGTKGRISVRWDPSTTVSAFTKADVGCTMQDLDKKRNPKDPRGTFVMDPRRACAKDGRIWAMVSCTTCRIGFAGWSATGVIAEMTKEQSLAFQDRLGLAKVVPLTTTEAWSNAIASAAN